MCGIVGVASPGPMSVQMKEFFQSLLFHDVVRGHHATGVAAIDTLDRSLNVEKKAIPSPVFLNDEEIMDNLFHYKHNFNIYIGHNRWATSGAKDADVNAHPFIHGDIVGVHNGSLRNQRLLDDHKDFVVDSDNLFYHLNKNGLGPTVTKTDGAYALCWYDKSDNTLNFIHNGERPLALGKLTNGCYVWASEFGMLTWLVRRHKALAFDTYMEDGVKMQNVYNVAKNKHVKIGFKDKTRQFDGDMEVTEYVPPTFPSTNWTNDDYYGNNRRNNWGTTNNPSTRTVHTPVVTEAEKKAKAAIEMFLAGAKVHDSVLEVKFLGNVKSKVPNGTYVGELALFEYRSKNGMVIKLHSFVYVNAFTANWGDDKIGTKVYVAMGSVCEHNNSTYIEARNDMIGHTISAIKHTLVKPNRLFPYYEEGAADSKVVPFRGKTQQTTEAGTTSTTEQSQHGASSDSDLSDRIIALEQKEQRERAASALLDKPDGLRDFMKMKVQLANGFTTQGDFIEMMAENHHKCSDCGKKMTDLVSSRIYLFEHFDRQEGKTYNYLSCRKICDEDMREVCAEIDKDYDKLYGGNDA